MTTITTLRRNLVRLLTFLKLVDVHDGNMSLVNLAVMVGVGKLAFATGVSVTDIAALMTVLLAYHAKKMVNTKTGSTSEEQVKAADVAATAAAQVKTLSAEVTTWNAKLDSLVGSLRLGGKAR